MANPNRQSKPSIERTVQDMVGWSFDNEFKVLTVATVEYDGSSLVRKQSDTTATRLDNTASPILYIGKAPIGSDESDAVWQIAKLDTSSGLIKTWADDARFSQVWDDRTILTYS